MEFFLTILGLFLYFFFAGSESAFNSFSKLKFEIWKKQDKKIIRFTEILIRKPELFFSSILIGNNIANTLAGTFATVFLLHYFSETASWIIITFTVLLIGEIVPKSLFQSLADRLISSILLFVYLFYLLLKPFIVSINFLVEIVLRLLHVDHRAVDVYFSRDELELLVREQYGNATRRLDKHQYVDNILNFFDISVKEAMIPRIDLPVVSHNTTFDALIGIFQNSEYKFVLVYKDNPDNILGVLYIHELFAMEDGDDFQKLIRQIPIVPENKNCAPLLRDFQTNRQSLALVVDEHGSIDGLIRIEDIVEEVFSGYNAVYDKKKAIRALNAHTWLVNARSELDEIELVLSIEFPQGDYETLAGYVLHTLGHIPEVGELVIEKDFRLIVSEVERHKIKRVKIIKKKLKKTEKNRI